MANPNILTDAKKPTDLVQQVLDDRAKRAGNSHQTSREVSQRWHTVRLDAEVAEFYKATGEGWQIRINEALRKLAGI